MIHSTILLISTHFYYIPIFVWLSNPPYTSIYSLICYTPLVSLYRSNLVTSISFVNLTNKFLFGCLCKSFLLCIGIGMICRVQGAGNIARPFYLHSFSFLSLNVQRDERILLTQMILYECTIQCVHNNGVVVRVSYLQTKYLLNLRIGQHFPNTRT